MATNTETQGFEGIASAFNPHTEAELAAIPVDDNNRGSDERQVPDNGELDRNKAQRLKRIELDGKKCPFTGVGGGAFDVTHVIPFSSAKSETKRLQLARLFRETGQFLGNSSRQYGENRIREVLVSRVGGSDAKWNMVCMSKTLHDMWGRAMFALEFIGTKDAVFPAMSDDDIVTLQLRFRWMPRRRMHAGKPISRLPYRADEFHEEFDGITESIFSSRSSACSAPPISSYPQCEASDKSLLWLSHKHPEQEHQLATFNIEQLFGNQTPHRIAIPVTDVRATMQKIAAKYSIPLDEFDKLCFIDSPITYG
jgi:hypothetical protein